MSFPIELTTEEEINGQKYLAGKTLLVSRSLRDRLVAKKSAKEVKPKRQAKSVEEA